LKKLKDILHIIAKGRSGARKLDEK
jgi:hypothetical protein